MTQIEPIPYSLPDSKDKDKDPLAAICAIMDKVLERDLEIPDDIIRRLIEEIERLRSKL